MNISTMMSTNIKTVDQYIKQFDSKTQDKLKEVEATIEKASPKATWAIKYGIPTRILNGNLIHFGAFKDHIGLYPGPGAIMEFKTELKPYQLSKGTIQIPNNLKIPKSLITKIVKHRIKVSIKK